MDKLWAPWRSKYVRNVHSIKGCIFCSKPKANKDRANHIISRSRHAYSILNIYPYNNGHMMVVPFRHVNDISKLTDEELSDLMNLLKETKARLAKALNPHGFNIGINLGRAAGAGYKDHVHIHIVPRWQGDANFMPVITSTKIVSQSLDELYKKLTRCLPAKK